MNFDRIYEDAQSNNSQIVTNGQAGNNANSNEYLKIVEGFSKKINILKEYYQKSQNMKNTINKKSGEITKAIKAKDKANKDNLQYQLNKDLNGSNDAGLQNILELLERCENNFKELTATFEANNGFKAQLENYIKSNPTGNETFTHKDDKGKQNNQKNDSKALQNVQKDNKGGEQQPQQEATPQSENQK